MRTTIAALLAALLLLAGCGKDKAEPAPTTSTATQTTPATTPTPSPMVIGYGSIGAATVGMTKQQAVATGLFDADVSGGADSPCGPKPLAWKAAYKGVDVLTSEAGTIVSMGVWKDATLKTAKGIGPGSTLGDLKAAYPDLQGPTDAGYGQSGAWVSQGGDWIGFLLDPVPGSLVDSSPITFIEVTSGAQPQLIRDGC